MIEHDALLSKVKARMALPLPGHEQFLQLGGIDRPGLKEALRKDPEPRESAVLILLFPVGGSTYTLLIERPEYDGVHSGQIAFPGGRREMEDADLQATAIREFEEEIGMSTMRISMIGELSKLYIPPSRSLVTPFVASVATLSSFDPDPTEVHRIIKLDLDDILLPNSIKRSRTMRTSYGKMKVPYFEADGSIVWGATAMMLAEMRQLLLE